MPATETLIQSALTARQTTPSEHSTTDKAMLLATARLEAIDPLLVTFHSNYSSVDMGAHKIADFERISSPLRDAWLFKMLRGYSQSAYEREIESVVERYSSLFENVVVNKKHTCFSGEWWEFISKYMILHEKADARSFLDITLPSVGGDNWSSYMSMLRVFTKLTPNPSCYTLIPAALIRPYKITIQNLPGTHHRWYCIEGGGQGLSVL